MNSNIQYRMVAGEDFIKSGLAKRMLDDGEPLPNLILAVGFIATDNDEIVSYGVLQNLPVIEPVKANPGYGECIREIFSKLEGFVLKSKAPRVLAHSEHSAMQKMMRRVGFDASPWKWFDWRKENRLCAVAVQPKATEKHS